MTSRFKGLDLVDRVPEELWMDICNTAQEVVTKTTPKKKKYKKAKWFSEEALQRPEERREAKSKGERERYTQLNVEFQKTAKRDKKTFLNEQCKEVEENNRVGKTRDLLKKNWRYQENISYKYGHNEGQKQPGPNRSRRD